MALSTVQAANDIEINSFMTLGFASSTNDDGTYLNRINNHISLENDSHYGLNITIDATKQLKGAAQLLATSDKNNFNIEAEWAYLSYKLNNQSNIRAGKLNLSTFLLSDYITVGSLYPWIRPPEEVYANNPMKNFLGLEWLYVSHIGQAAKLTSQFFIGSAQVQPNALTLFRAMDGYGINFQLDTRDFTFRAGAISPEVQVQIETAAGTIDVDQNDRALMYTLGMSWDLDGFIGYTEYVKTKVDGETRALFPDQTGFYITLGYQMGKYQPFITLANSDGDVYTGNLPDPLLPGAAAPNKQESTALGLRYDIDNNIDMKFEYKQVTPQDGSTGLNSTLPTDGDSFDIISLAVDVIF
ncbi:MAG: hypothetical protein OEY43_02340 [Gammaproteobacteria bacterium]|nr:hypothetical protein [Gammaproteobacteria bacterium]